MNGYTASVRVFGPDVLLKNLPLPKRLLSIRGHASAAVGVREPPYTACVVSAQLATMTEMELEISVTNEEIRLLLCSGVDVLGMGHN